MASKTPSRAVRKRDLHRLAVARSDITAALFAARHAIKVVKDLGDEAHRPMLEAVVISYSRPFTNNKPVGALPAKWARFSSVKMQNVHDAIIAHRNKFVAHSDPYERTVYIVPPFVPIRGAGTHFVKVGVAVRTTSFPVDFFRAVEATCLDLGKRLNTAVEALVVELYEKEVLPAAQFPVTFDNKL